VPAFLIKFRVAAVAEELVLADFGTRNERCNWTRPRAAIAEIPSGRRIAWTGQTSSQMEGRPASPFEFRSDPAFADTAPIRHSLWCSQIRPFVFRATTRGDSKSINHRTRL